MKTKQWLRFAGMILLVCASDASSQETPDIIDYRDGQVTWTNVNPALYYSVEWLPSLTAENWTSSFRSLQDLQSSEPYMSAEVPMFFRIVGSSNALHTFALSPESPNVVEGYYAVTNLTQVDADLAPANLAKDVSVFGVTGSAIVATGDASETQVLEGSSFSVSGMSGLVGTMPNLGAVTIVPGTTPQSIAQGYHDGTGTVAGDANLLTGNIRSGVTIFGVGGNAEVVDTSSGDAAAGDLLQGKTAWAAGAEVVGTMPNVGAVAIVPGTTPQSIAQGYHDGTGTVAGDANLLTGNIRSGVTIFGVGGNAEVVDTSSGDVAAGDLLQGKTAWAAGVEVVGTMPNVGAVAIVPGTTPQSIAQGYHDGTGTVAGDANLATENIRSGVAVFGVTGKPEVVDTSNGNAAPGDVVEGKTAWVNGLEVLGTRTSAPVPKTGQTNTFRPGDDGDLEAGVDWPSPRFTVQTDADVVRDNLTGLMWTLSANIDGPKDWPSAVDFCQTLDHGGYDDWRLPNIRELQSLIDFGQFDPALPVGHDFIDWQSDNYWSSTMLADPSGDAWFMRLTDGYIDVSGTAALQYVWPVRGGQ